MCTYKRSQSGFTLVEVLISLAICAMLMAAVASAFNAAAMGYQENRDIYNALNNGRQALCRMTSELRTGYNVDPNDPNTECSFVTSAGESITYRYVPNDSNLYLVKGTAQYTLCENVSSMVFTRTTTEDGNDCTSVQMLLQVQSGDVEKDLAAAAVIRRNL